MTADHGLSVTVLGQGALSRASETLKTLLYRLVREILFRLAAQVDRQARISLVETGHRLRIVVEGSGDGLHLTLPTDTDPRDTLKALLNQLKALGGTVETDACGEAGTCLTIEAPGSESV